MLSIKKTLLGLCLVAGITAQSHAVEFGLGVRAGAEMTLNSQLAKTDNGTYKNPQTLLFDDTFDTLDLNERNLGAAFTMGLFGDIWLFDWMALTPAFNMSLFRNASITIKEAGEEIKLSSTNHAFDIELLAKFKIGWWYGAVGLGVSIVTAPNMKVTTSFDTEGMDPAEFIFEGMLGDTKGHIGFNIILDTGVYIPLGAGNHNIMVGLRATMDILAMTAKSNDKFTKDLLNGDLAMTDIKGTAQAAPFAIGLTVGYVYKF